jgi:hypothetical protein
MNNYITESDTRICTVSGTLFALILQVDVNHLLNTAITAATGALVSWLVAVSCKYISNRYFSKNGRSENGPTA